MSPIVVAAVYGLIGGLLGNLLAAIIALAARWRVRWATIGTALAASGGFILGTAFLDLIAEARSASNDLIVGVGLALGILLMIGLGLALGAVGLHEEEEEGDEPAPAAADRLREARLLAIGIGIHNIPEALPIGAALVISPRLSLLIALLMTIENLAESGAIAGELVAASATAGYLVWETVWPGLLSVIGAPIGVLLAGISPTLLALTLSLAGGIMLFIVGEVWTDSRQHAGVPWSSVGLLVGVLFALATATSGPA